MEDDSNVRVNKLAKAQRKPRAKKEEEPVVEETAVDVPETEETPEPPKPTKKTKAKAEEYDVEQQEPDVVIHKRHKGAKPRKIIVITGDSDLDEEDEKMPYRKAPKVEVRKREPVKARSPSPEPAPRPPRKQNVGLIAGDPKKEYHDSGKGVSQPHAKPSGPKTYVVDSFIDSMLGL